METIVVVVPVRSVLALDDAKALWHELGKQLAAAEAVEAATADA